jgi:hypothetical protein
MLKNKIMHHKHMFLLIYSHTHFYNSYKKNSQQIHTINLQKQILASKSTFNSVVKQDETAKIKPDNVVTTGYHLLET